MIGDFFCILALELEPAIAHQLVEILGDENHLEVDHELGIFVFEAVVAMRGGDHDFLDATVDKGLDVVLGQPFEQIFIAGLADAFSAAAFPGTQDAKIDSGLVQNGWPWRQPPFSSSGHSLSNSR